LASTLPPYLCPPLYDRTALAGTSTSSQPRKAYALSARIRALFRSALPPASLSTTLYQEPGATCIPFLPPHWTTAGLWLHLKLSHHKPAWPLPFDTTPTGLTYSWDQPPSFLLHALTTLTLLWPYPHPTSGIRYPTSALLLFLPPLPTATSNLRPLPPPLLLSAECPICPWNFNSTCPTASTLWSSLSDELWFQHALADDWVRLNILSPLSGAPPLLIPTNSLGAHRAALLDNLVPWSTLLPLISPTRLRARMLSSTLRSSLHRYLTDLNAITLLSDEFWFYIARYATSVGGWPGSPTHNRLRPYWHNNTLSLRLLEDVPGECSLPELWANRYPLSTDAFTTISQLDNAIS